MIEFGDMLWGDKEALAILQRQMGTENPSTRHVREFKLGLVYGSSLVVTKEQLSSALQCCLNDTYYSKTNTHRLLLLLLLCCRL
jgi:hypothetical protein